jgi:hypothetical protein
MPLHSIALLAAAALAPAAVVTPWPLPAGAPSSQPSLALQGETLHLSWIEPEAHGHRLRHARDPGVGFAEPADIARGRGWFVNWADFPTLAVLADGSLAAHLLVKRSDAPYAYDVLLLRSADGTAWSRPVLVHDDDTATEHGFVSLWPDGDHGLGVAWLDGRATGDGQHDHEGHGGAMMLRAARFDAAGKQDDRALDESTCDCCQTDVALAARGPVLVYRDRAEGEIRDIALTRLRGGRWSAPALVHPDGWRMPACPVNGPAVAARSDEIHVAWYTAADGEPQVRLARSRDDGAHFGEPRVIARGAQVQGRVDVQRDAGQVVLSWIDEDAGGQTLRLARFPPDLSKEIERVEVARLPRGRGTGFPRLALRAGAAYLVWTDVVERVPRISGARIDFATRAKAGAPAPSLSAKIVDTGFPPAAGRTTPGL